MFGLDDRIVALADGGSIWIVLAVAVLLGLRHATDPDHIAAVSTLVAGGSDRATRRAGGLGLAWGLGHALTLFAFGLPILLLGQLPPRRRPAGSGDRGRRRHRLSRRAPLDPVEARRVPRARPSPRGGGAFARP